MDFVRKNINAPSGGNVGSGGTVVNNGGSALETHTIFGQPYNGTNDVKGDLSDVNKITANGDISTDGKLIVKGIDEEGAYTDKDLNISKDESTKFTGGDGYGFDDTVTAPKFKGDIEGDNGYIKTLGADTLASAFASFTELIAEKGNIKHLESENVLADNVSVDTLTVTKAAHFFSLIIDEIKSVGGQIILSPASATLDMVKKTSSGNYKCYFRSKIDDKEISNQFASKDQVVCQTFNVAEGTSYNVSNTFYWRMVISRGKETLNGIDYHFIILSGTDCADDSGEPKEGDRVVTLGNRTLKDRQNAIVLSAYNSQFLDKGLQAPSMVQYTGINDYSLTGHRQNVISNGLNQFVGNFKVTTGESVTDLIDSTKFNRIILEKAIATVNAYDELVLDVEGYVIPLSDKMYEVDLTGDNVAGVGLAVDENKRFAIHSIYQKDYSQQANKITYFTIQLRQETAIIESVNIPVIFETGALLSVMDDRIESAVQNVEGDISRVEQMADGIEAKIVSEDKIKSMISQNKDGIKAEVFDEMNKATGINVTNGSITLNADKTTIKGNLNITDTNNGLTVYETASYKGKDTLIPRINLQPKNIADITDLANDTFDYYTKSFSQQNNSSWSLDYGYKDVVCKKNDTVTLDLFHLNEIRMNSNNNLNAPTSNTCTLKLILYLVNNGTAIEQETKTFTLTKTNDYGQYDLKNYQERFSIPGDGTYRFAFSSIFNLSASASFPIMSATLSVRFQKASSAITYIGNDGMYCHSGANKCFYVNEKEFTIQQGFSGIKWDNSDRRGNRNMMVVTSTTGSIPNLKPVWFPFYNYTPIFIPNSYEMTKIVNDGNSYSKYAYKINPLKDSGICYLETGYYDANMKAQDLFILLPPSFFKGDDGKYYSLPYGYTVQVINGGFGTRPFNVYVSADVDKSHSAVFVDGHRDKNWKVSLNGEVHWDKFVYMGSFYSDDCQSNQDIWMTLQDAQ